jgi:hypothetical protein
MASARAHAQAEKVSGPVFSGPLTPLRLLETRRLDGSSLVLDRYDARTSTS